RKGTGVRIPPPPPCVVLHRHCRQTRRLYASSMEGSAMSYERLTQPDPEGHPPEVQRIVYRSGRTRLWGVGPGLPFGGYSSKRPNRFGWVLIFSGAVFWALTLLQ